jgi:hypothetical protein
VGRLLAALLLSALAPQQVDLTVPNPRVPGDVDRTGGQNYGPPRVADLESLDVSPETYHRRNVITVGILEPLTGEYFTLRDGSPRVLVIPGFEVTSHDLGPLAGRRVEIRGVFRRIRPKEYTAQGVDWDLLEDPTLPVLPAPDFKLPRNSITVLGVADRSSHDSSRSPGAEGVSAADILEDPGAYADKKVRLVGRFRGRNLFEDLPARSQQQRSDWVLLQDEGAFWVTGKAPRGKGWTLDLDYRGDSVRFLAVEGKAEVVNGVLYLRASRVELAKDPKAENADAGPP